MKGSRGVKVEGAAKRRGRMTRTEGADTCPPSSIVRIVPSPPPPILLLSLFAAAVAILSLTATYPPFPVGADALMMVRRRPAAAAAAAASGFPWVVEPSRERREAR